VTGPRDIERRVLLSILDLTREGPTSSATIRRRSRVPESTLREFLERLYDGGLIRLSGDRVEASPTQRIGIAVRAVVLGGDLERVSRGLGWLEFENFVALAFQENGYAVRRHLRFRSQGRRWEVDLLALRRPLMVLVECKHWLHGLAASIIRKTVKEHLAKAKAFTEALPGLRRGVNLLGWSHATVVPALVSLTQSPFKFYEAVPIVPVLQLPSFISDLPAHIPHLAHLRVELPPSLDDLLPEG